MLYLNENDIKEIGINWIEVVECIKDSVLCIDKKEYAQPIKPYLRYREPENRIIAMPAFVGGNFDMAGIKWIASFPKNIKDNIPRAHSVIILNDSYTGQPVGIINTPLLSIIRTIAVSGTMIKYYTDSRNIDKVNLGIIGWGPIGQYHYRMFKDLYGDKLSKLYLYDIQDIAKNSVNREDQDKLNIADCWQDSYLNSNIVITSTVSEKRYIDEKPKDGALLLNISLRDYKKEVYAYVKDGIIVDDWDEVCRENTDIELFNKHNGLKEENTKTIIDVICRKVVDKYPSNQVLMFNPMGMAVFDIAVASYYYNKAIELGIGTKLVS